MLWFSITNLSLHFLGLFLYLQTATFVFWEVHCYFAVVMNARFGQLACCLLPVFVTELSLKEESSNPQNQNIFYPDS